MKPNLLKSERLLLFAAILLVFLASASIGRFGPNPSSRFMLTKDIVLYHQLNLSKADVDFYSGLDYSIKNNTLYSDKPPGFSFLTVPLYVAGDYLYKIGISLPRTDSFNYGGDANAFFLMVIFVIVFNAVGCVKFFDVLRLLKFNKKAALITTMIFAFGTLFFVYSYNLFLHSFVATLLIFSVYYLFKGGRNLILSGTFLGFAILCEYTIVLIGPFFVFYILSFGNFRKNFLNFILPVLILMSLLGLYNWTAFASPFSFSYMYSTFIDTQKFDHPPLQGLNELTVSNWRGLFFYNPIFLLSFLGFFWLQKSYKRESYLFMFSFLIYLLFFATYRYLSGGLSYGPRHLVSVLPFLGFLLAPCFDKRYYEKIKEFGFNRIFYFAVILILLAVSFFHTFLGIFVTPEAAPEIDLNPIYNYSWKFVLRGDRNSFLLMHYPQVYYVFLVVAFLLLINILRGGLRNQKES